MLSPAISHPGTAGAYCDYLLPPRLVTLHGPLPWRHTYYRAINAYLDALRVPIYLRVGVFDSLSTTPSLVPPGLPHLHAIRRHDAE
jgi:hypothetical protein